MKSERIEEIYTELRNNIRLPSSDVLSWTIISDIIQKCDDFGNKLEGLEVEVQRDIDRLEHLMGVKKDFYEARTEELIIEGGPRLAGISSDGGKLRRAQYLLKAEKTEIALLDAELKEVKALKLMIGRHHASLEEKNKSAKKQWEIFNGNQKMYNAGTRATTPLVFSDPFVENVMQATAKGTDETLDNKQGAEVDFQANNTLEAAPGELYKAAEPPTKSHDSEKSKVELGQSSIIKEEGGDLSAILDSL